MEFYEIVPDEILPNRMVETYYRMVYSKSKLLLVMMIIDYHPMELSLSMMMMMMTVMVSS